MATADSPRRVIRVGKSFVGPPKPRECTVQPRKVSDYPRVAREHLDVAEKLSSPTLAGPPICDELVAFVEHVFTEEEASLVRHLGTMKARSASRIARAARCDVDTAARALEHLAYGKKVIWAEGPVEGRRYRLLPLMPGMFELALIGVAPDAMTEWHRGFAERFDAIFETGYMLEYRDGQIPAFRFLPVDGTTGAHPAALPSDQLEVVLDRYDSFGVGHCQCRATAGVRGAACDTPSEVCAVMGKWADMAAEGGFVRRVSKQELLEIKRNAESHGLVTWILNVESAGGQASCSCCGCCCKAMRIVSEFNAPGMIAPPHFMPRFDRESCTCCGLCATKCPMAAITVDRQQQTLEHEPARCIGCGLCMQACGRQRAIRMEPVPDYRVPYKSWLSLLLRNAPKSMRNALKVWRNRT